VEQSTPDTVHVVETSSFQLETTTTFHPWIAVWLNFADDHLDRHPTVAAYAAAKARIFANQDANDWAVLNADDPAVLEQARGAAARRVIFSLEGDARTVSSSTATGSCAAAARRPNGSSRLTPSS